MEVVDCTDMEEGWSKMDAAPHIRCYVDDEWNALHGPAWFFMALYLVCLPSALVFLLYRSRHKLWRVDRVRNEAVPVDPEQAPTQDSTTGVQQHPLERQDTTAWVVGDMPEDVTDIVQTGLMHATFGSLYLKYRPQCFLWEMVICMHKLILQMIKVTMHCP